MLQEIRGLFRICTPQFAGEQYRPIRKFLYGYTSGKLSHKQLVALCEVRTSSPVSLTREVETCQTFCSSKVEFARLQCIA